MRWEPDFDHRVSAGELERRSQHDKSVATEPPAQQGTWPIATQWPDEAFAQMDGRWFRLAHIGEGRYEVVDGPFGTYQRAFLSGQEA